MEQATAEKEQEIIEVDERIARYAGVTDLHKTWGSKYKIFWDGTKKVDPDKIEWIWYREIRGVLGMIYPCGFNGDLALYCDNHWSVLDDVIKNAGGRRVNGIHPDKEEGWTREGVVRFPAKNAQYVFDKIHAHKR